MGRYGSVSVAVFDGQRLPYADNMVHLVIAERLANVDIAEVLRVLTPNGVAAIHRDGGYIVHEGYIYGNNGNGWACIDLKTGQTKWEERAVGKGSVCFADGKLYLFAEKGGRVGLGTCSPEALELRGSFAVPGKDPSWAHPVVIGGRLYLRYDDNLYCYDVTSG